MAAFGNLVFQFTTSTGTGNLTLTALSAEATPQYFRNFSTVFGTGSGSLFYYCIRNQALLEFEVGIGYMSDTTTLVRQTVIESSNANALVNFSVGTKDVISDIPAEYQASIADAQTWTGLQTFEGIPVNTYTVDNVTNPVMTDFNYLAGGNWIAGGYDNLIQVYAYKNTPVGKVYSPAPVQSPSYIDDNSTNDYAPTWSWDAVSGADGYILLRYSSDPNAATYSGYPAAQMLFDFYTDVGNVTSFQDYGDIWSNVLPQFVDTVSEREDAAHVLGPIRFYPDESVDSFFTAPIFRVGFQSDNVFEYYVDIEAESWRFRNADGTRSFINANLNAESVISTNINSSSYTGNFYGTVYVPGANNRLALLNSSGILTYASTFKYIDTSGGGIAIGSASVTPTGSFKAWFNDSSTNSVQILFTNSSTGNTVSDGYGIGIDTAGAAIFNQRENNTMKWATNNVFYGQLNPTNGAWGFGNSSILAQTAAQMAVQSTGTTVVTQVLKAIASQSADILQIQNSSGTVLSKIDVSGDMSVPDEAYGPGWNGSLEVPTKNALYDKIETITGGGNSATAEVDFGFPSGNEGDIATVTVAAAWVTGSSVIVVSPLATATADHDPEDYAIEGITAYATNIVDGVGFDIIASAPRGTWGRYNISAIGV